MKRAHRPANEANANLPRLGAVSNPDAISSPSIKLNTARDDNYLDSQAIARPSAEGAERTAPKLSKRQSGVLDEFKSSGPGTPEEIAERMTLSRATVAPRCSELVRLGLIRRTSQRRPNASGLHAAVLEAVPRRDGGEQCPQ
jgi:hypothetical protein